ncbi:MAG: hypothetical protein ISR46_05455 [Rhodospirillales bacterium]|nr:hypothetical protein [Rhodospirillales bacterium]
MSQTIKRIWIAYAVLSVVFGLYAITADGDVFAWFLRLSLPHLGFIMWYALNSDKDD